MGKAPTFLPEDRSEWPTFLSGGNLPKVGDPDPEEGAGEGSEGHLAAPHVLGYGSMGRGRYSVQQQGMGAGTYTLQPTSSSVPNPSACEPRMHGYAIRAGGAGATAVLVVPGLLTVRTPVIATHTVIGTPSAAASASASASVPPSVSLSVSGASSSRRSDSKSTTSTTSSASASEDIDGDEDIDSQHGGLHRLRR